MLKKTRETVAALVFAFQCVLCHSQSSTDHDMWGNWYPGYLGDVAEVYTEFFIDASKIYYFYSTTESIVPRPYYISNSKLYIDRSNNREFEVLGEISISNDTLYIANGAGLSFFLRQKEKPNLKDVIDNYFSFDAFFEGYLSRAAHWNEKKYK
ncbi:MAG: hypothetical protein AAGC45_06640 [Bacteroidota bacterium]